MPLGFLDENTQFLLFRLPTMLFLFSQISLAVDPSPQQQSSSGGTTQTPVIGGPCKIGTPDVQIGGKQTQFFLHCEPNVETLPGEGIWVVKSRSAAVTAGQIPASAVAENAEKAAFVGSAVKKTPARPTLEKSFCELDFNAQENAFCSEGNGCLQPYSADREAFLHCDSSNHRWAKRSCQNGFSFNFDRQSCVANSPPVVAKGSVFRQFPTLPAPVPNSAPAGLVCTYAQCSPAIPCQMGTCNNGYCCTAVPAPAPAPLPPASPPIAFSQFPTALAKKENATKTSFHKNIVSGGSTRRVLTPRSANLTTTIVNSTLTTLITTTAVSVPLEQMDAIGDWSYQPANHDPSEMTNFGRMPMHSMPNPSNTDYEEKDGGICSSGFKSPLHCSSFFECPPGLACDFATSLCCPLPPSPNVAAGREQKSAPLQTAPFPKELYRKFQPHFRKLKYGELQQQKSGGVLPSPFSAAKQQHHFRRYNNFNANVKQHQNVIDPVSAFTAGIKVRRTYQGPAFALPPLPPPPPPPPMTAAASPMAYACPGGLPAFGQCIAGRCGPGYACSPPANVCCAMPTAIPATVCPDGTQAAGACVNGQCGTGFTCNQGLCCSNSSQTPRCLDGSQAIGACIQGKCGTGYTCTTGHICCPSTLNVCPNGQNSIGQCVNNACPAGYTCINNVCCPDAGGIPPGQTTPPVSCPQEDSNGPCIGDPGTCPEPGFLCDTAHNWCCPQTTGEPVGPCIKGEGGDRLCPDGYACKGEGEGQCYRLDVETCHEKDQAGPCSTEDDCPPDYKDCRGGYCCREGSPSVPNTRRAKRSTSTFLRMIRAH